MKSKQGIQYNTMKNLGKTFYGIRWEWNAKERNLESNFYGRNFEVWAETGNKSERIGSGIGKNWERFEELYPRNQISEEHRFDQPGRI